jgi:hypothetical protein
MQVNLIKTAITNQFRVRTEIHSPCPTAKPAAGPPLFWYVLFRLELDDLALQSLGLILIRPGLGFGIGFE